MKIKIWGCRGSIATPGAHVIRYGGNTTCLEVRTAANQVFLIDAGSGARKLGQALAAEAGLNQLTWLFTHAHWDHLSGFPFFIPAYLSRFRIALCGGPDAQYSIRRYLAQQMEAPFFPVEFGHLKAHFDFHCQCGECVCPENLACSDDALHCASIALNHPNGGVGFRLTQDGRSFVFLPDNELGYLHPGAPSRAQQMQFCAGADLLIHDAQYTDAEYERTRGWGHSTFADAVDFALAAGVKRLGLFHHDPDRSDDDLDQQVQACRQRITRAGSSMQCFACAEEIELDV